MIQLAIIMGVVLGLAFKQRPRALLIAVAIATFGMAAEAASAYGPPSVNDVARPTLLISATSVTMLVAVFIPVLTGLLTRLTTSGWAKGLITLVANGITSLIATSTMADGTALLSWQTFVGWFVGFVTSIGLYTGLWKPAGITSSLIETKGREVAGKLAYVGLK